MRQPIWSFRHTLLAVVALGFTLNTMAAVRIKDIARMQGQRQYTLVGQGIVTGLAGTGDSPGSRGTRQSLANLMAQFNVVVPPESITSRNVAIVMVSASVSAFSRSGDSMDVTVTSIGDARSLVGGNLLLLPLKGPDGKTYALAQGALTVGGYKYDANGNVMQRNHPTAAVIPGGGTLEVDLPGQSAEPITELSLSLQSADYTTAGRVADAINRSLGEGMASPVDAQNVSVKIPSAYTRRIVQLISRLETLDVDPDQRAMVVVNERTGTVVAGASVQIAPVAISYGDLRISVVSETAVSQPTVYGGIVPGVTSIPYTNTRVDVREPSGATLVTKSGGTVADLVQALAKLKTNTRDVVSILKALKTAGSLHAELVVQ